LRICSHRSNSFYIWKVQIKNKFRNIIDPSRLTGIGIHQNSLRHIFYYLIILSETWTYITWTLVFLFRKCFERVPMYDPVVTSDLHWREIELSGMSSPFQSFKKSLKFLLFGVSATALTLASVYIFKF